MLRVFPISLTRAASLWLRNKPTGLIKTWEDLKTKFLNKYCPHGRTAKKMKEINNFQQKPDETLYQAWERFKELLMKCPQHHLTEMQETVADAKTAIQEMAEYSQKWHNGTSRGRSTKTSDGLADIQAQLSSLGTKIKKVNEKVYAAQVGWGYRATAPGYYLRNNANPSYQERRQSIKDTLSKFMSESEKRHEENSNLIKEIRATTDATIRNQGASIKTLEIQNQENEQADSYSIRRIGSSQYAVSTIQYKSRQMMVPFPSRLDNHYCEDEEGNYGPKFTKAYGASRASVSVIPPLTYLNLGLDELAHTKLTVELADRTMKYPKGIAENILVGIGKFTFSLDFIVLDMPEDIKVPLILERPFLSTAHAKIDVYKRKITLRLRRNQGDDLIPTIEECEVNEECEVIEEFRTRDEDLGTGINDYPSYCDDDKKIHIDCAHNLKFSCMIGFEFTHINFFLLLYVNVMSKKFHNSIMKDKTVYKGDNVVGALMNMHFFVGTFSVMTDFAVLEDMDAYRDEEMGDVIVGEPFLREVEIKAKRFDGMITIYNGNDEVTYQM
ncbi:hypothetical protein Tco_1416553, partial [Tanacetum coccineum]